MMCSCTHLEDRLLHLSIKVYLSAVFLLYIAFGYAGPI